MIHVRNVPIDAVDTEVCVERQEYCFLHHYKLIAVAFRFSVELKDVFKEGLRFMSCLLQNTSAYAIVHFCISVVCKGRILPQMKW